MFPALPVLLQLPPEPTTVWWLEVIRSPAFVLLALAVCTKWIVAPAILTFLRHELRGELDQLKDFPLVVDRVGRMEKTIETLAEMPGQLGRIEEQVNAIHREASRPA